MHHIKTRALIAGANDVCNDTILVRWDVDVHIEVWILSELIKEGRNR